jgi:thiol-disulfide isomerase/thioredoxin
VADLAGNPVAEGAAQLDRGELDAAIRSFQRALRASPDSFTAQLRLAQAYARKAARERDSLYERLSDKAFDEAMRLAGSDPDRHEHLLEVGIAMGRAEVLADRYRGAWSGLPFAQGCLARLRESEPPKPSGSVRLTPAVRGLLAVAAVAAGIGLWRTAVEFLGGGGSLWPTGVASAHAAPDFSLKELGGDFVSLSDFRGRAVVVLDFWATWCGPCVQSMPALEALRKKYTDKGAEVLSVNVGEDERTVRAFLEQRGFKLRVLLDPANHAANAYQVRGIPTMVIIDKAGGLRERFVGYGPGREAQIEQAINKYL